MEWKFCTCWEALPLAYLQGQRIFCHSVIPWVLSGAQRETLQRYGR